MPYNILVVEDDKNINGVVSEYLKEAGFRVYSAENGRDAREMLSAGPGIDVFILDIMLPHITGLELLKIIRSEKRFDESAVVMLTALNDEYTQLKSFEGLADDYVTKPFSPKILVKRVQALLRRSGKSGSQLKLGEISIDLDSYQAYEFDEKVQLTLREFELLRVFMTNPKIVQTRQQLLDLVWGYDYFGDERIVDVHIKNLRKKFSRNIIATVKGVGYKWERSCD